MRPPDHAGTHGDAWELEPGEKTAAHWLIYAPGQAAAWDYYIVAVLDLAGQHDGTDASLDFPDARWEIAVFALDPSEPVPDPDTNLEDQRVHPLTPQNVRIQLPDHPRELIVDTTRALVLAAIAGMWGLRFEPMFQHDQDATWRGIAEETLRHPHHHGDDRG